MDSALNNLQRLTYHKTQTNQTNPQVFRSRFAPIHSYKTVNKRSQTSSCHRGLLLGRIIMRHISDKIKDRWHRTNPHHNQHAAHIQVPGISTTRSRPLIACQPTPHHHVAHNQANQPRTNLHPLTFRPLSGGRREPVAFLIYQLLFKIDEIKSNPLVCCLLQPHVCL